MKVRIAKAIFWALISVFGLAAMPVTAQSNFFETARVTDITQCKNLKAPLRKNRRGGQWLIGNKIPIYGQSNATQPFAQTREVFRPVSCYGLPGTDDKIFVADDQFQVCGWVKRSDLLADRRRVNKTPNRSSEPELCPPQQAMVFEAFCEKSKSIGSLPAEIKEACITAPPNLRTKGVLTGIASESDAGQTKFWTTPIAQEPRATKTFFSVLSIFDVAKGQDSEAMALVGEGGGGEMFGWIKVSDLEIWPTRIGLFYDEEGFGSLFLKRSDLVQNWREGTPEPQITFGGNKSDLGLFIHGDLPLLSYPVVSTVDINNFPKIEQNDVPPHQKVVFLGQSGEGSASRLMAQAQRAKRVNALRKVNVMLVMDTTESMTRYLRPIQDGISAFIAEYGRDEADKSRQIPEMRIGVMAYSDFESSSRTSLDSKISSQTLLRPTPIGIGYNSKRRVEAISAHEGLRDKAGGYVEAALEMVARASSEFNGRGWFPDGPRIIIHIADHGSRESVSVQTILKRLKANNTIYYPIAVQTDDEGNGRRTAARGLFESQALRMLSPIIDNPRGSDLARIDFRDGTAVTSAQIEQALQLVLAEVQEAILAQRIKIVGKELSTAAMRVLDKASSRIKLDETLSEQYGLNDDTEEYIVQAAAGYAPLRQRTPSGTRELDWTYTVNFNENQLDSLRSSFEDLCAVVGKPEEVSLPRFNQALTELIQAISGETVESEEDAKAVLSDLRSVPGARDSFLSQSIIQLTQRIVSKDPAIAEILKRDVCWTSYSLNNVVSDVYVNPKFVQWTNAGFQAVENAQIIRRLYKYTPIVGAESFYLPSTFFILPSKVANSKAVEEVCKLFCD